MPGSKRYNFNSETLSFEIEKKKYGRKILRGLLSAVYINLAALVILIALFSFVESPEAQLQEARIERYNMKYQLISQKVDSLTHQLKQNSYPSDEIYRNILEMEPIPAEVRTAGTGGHDPYGSNFANYSNKVYTNLMAKIDNLKLQVGIQQKSYQEILDAALEKNLKVDHFPGIPPVNLTSHIWISSYFGSRSDPFTHHRKYHKGLDFVGPRNTEIFATADGTVTLAKHSRKGYGNEIVIDHNFGHSTRYAHLSEILVEKGQKVERGQLIGLMGNTGRSTGTHLHYEVRYNNRPLNPIYFFADDISPDEFEQLAKRTD